jgi:hypothetical protein
LSISTFAFNCSHLVVHRILKPLIKATLFTLGTLVGLAGLSLLAINLYVQSPEVQSRLRKAASDSIGCPINVFRITFSFWSGFHFRDVTIENPESDIPFLRAGDLRVQCEYLPLLRKKLIIRQVILTGPEIRIPVVGRPESAPAPADTNQLAPDTSSQPSTSASPPTAASPQNKAPNAKQPTAPSHQRKGPRGKFWVQIRKIKIRKGSVYLLGPNNVPLATLRNVESIIDYHKNDYFGKIDIASVTLSDSIDLEEISSPVKIANGELDLENIVAGISGGVIHGQFHLGLVKSPYPYDLRLEATAVNVNQIVNHAGGILDRAHGLLEAHFQMSGAGSDPSLAKGEGTLDIKNGYIDQFPVLQEIGRWTQIDELKRLDLDMASAKISVDGSDINLDDFKLVSKNCQIGLWGRIAAAQKLELKGRLTLSQFLSQKVPSELQDNFVTAPDGQERYLDFLVSGSITRPQTDLFDRLIGDKNRLLKRMLRGDRKDKHKDKAGDQ